MVWTHHDQLYHVVSNCSTIVPFIRFPLDEKRNSHAHLNAVTTGMHLLSNQKVTRMYPGFTVSFFTTNVNWFYRTSNVYAICKGQRVICQMRRSQQLFLGLFHAFTPCTFASKAAYTTLGLHNDLTERAELQVVAIN